MLFASVGRAGKTLLCLEVKSGEIERRGVRVEQGYNVMSASTAKINSPPGPPQATTPLPQLLSPIL